VELIYFFSILIGSKFSQKSGILRDLLQEIQTSLFILKILCNYPEFVSMRWMHQSSSSTMVVNTEHWSMGIYIN